MSGESLAINDRGRMPRWLAKIAGVTAISAALIAPACSSEPETFGVKPDTGMTVDVPEPIQVAETLSQQPEALVYRRSITRDTGMDRDPCWRFAVCGTDLLIPFKLPNGSYAYMTGDTFVTKGPYEQNLPPGGDKWRSPVMLRASQIPEEHVPIRFDNAAGLHGDGVAPEFIYNSHRRNGREVTVFPNDGVSLPDGRIVVSYQSVGGPNGEISPENANWSTNYSGLAVSTDGNNFRRILTGRDGQPGPGDPVWMNNEHNTDPSQMWSMQLDGDHVYIVSVRAGRTKGPMIMLRVPWREIENKGAYECWNGTDWGGDCAPILPDRKYGEPSLRKIDDGTPEGLWVMSYVDYTFTQLETRTAKNPAGPWSEPKMQIHWHELNALYGGFIHPASTPDNLILMVSTWQRDIDKDKYGEYGKLLRYDVSHFNTTTH